MSDNILKTDFDDNKSGSVRQAIILKRFPNYRSMGLGLAKLRDCSKRSDIPLDINVWLMVRVNY